MARSDATLRRVHRAYEGAHLGAALRALAIAGGLVALALGVHGSTRVMWLVAITLAATLSVLAWRGGPWRRGALAGVLAGLPPLIVPSIVLALSSRGHCGECTPAAQWACTLACFGSGSLVGILVGYRATARARCDRERRADRAPRLRQRGPRGRDRRRDRARRGRCHRLGRGRAYRARVSGLCFTSQRRCVW